jgi:crossover junction endodeoxyribonuclease RusA
MQLAELVKRATAPMVAQPVVLARLPAPISANRYWRTRVMIPPKGSTMPPTAQTYVSSEAKTFKESVAWLMAHQGVRRVITGRVQVDLRLLPHCPKDWKTRARKDPLYWADTVGRIDLDNAMKVVLDALKGVAIEDDVQVWRSFSEVLEPQEGEDECCILQLSRLVRENPQGGLAL